MRESRRKARPSEPETRAPPIEETRSEIMRLIRKLHGGAAAGTSPRRPATPERRGPAPERGAPEPPRAEPRRAPAEPQGTEAVLARLAQLEERVARLEQNAPAGGGGAARSAGGDEGRYALQGHVQGQLLADVLQLISSNAMTGVFVVESDGASNRMYFDEGQICHAEGEGLSGESALFAALAFEHGRYYFQETSDLPEEKTIESNTQFLILEALRQIDEQGAP